MDLHQQIAVVQAYINHRKDKEVDINLQQFNNPLNIIKLQKAYQIAIEWFSQNKGSITNDF